MYNHARVKYVRTKKYTNGFSLAMASVYDTQMQNVWMSENEAKIVEGEDLWLPISGKHTNGMP